MDNESFEQHELTPEQVDDAWRYLKEGMVCSIVLHNGTPISITPPNHVVLRVEYCEPGAKGNTATNVCKPCKVETGAEFPCPSSSPSATSSRSTADGRVFGAGERVGQ